MRVTYAVSHHRWLVFILATVLLQSAVISTALYLRSGKETATPLTSSEQVASLPNAADSGQPAAVETHTEAAPQAKTVKYKVLPGDTLTKIWVKNGSTVAAAVSAADAFRQAGISLNSLRLNEEIEITLQGENEIVGLKKKLPEGKTLILTGNSQDGYTAEIEQQPVIEKQRIVSYPIFNSFSLAAQEASVPAEITDDLVDLFSGRLDFNRDLRPGDSFTVIYNERVTESGEVLSPGIIKAVSIENNGKLLAAMRHAGKDGRAVYYDENGQPVGNYFLRYPLRFTRISSVFSNSRFHPILHVKRPHNGVDFAAPTGTPVRTVADGIVEAAGYGSGTGNMVKIRHDDRYTTAYLHLSKISVKKGARVSRGQLIGAVGMTGLATAPHLHFSLYHNDKFVDPLKAKLPVAPANGVKVPPAYITATLQTLKAQHEMVRLASILGLHRGREV
ncbi:MAG: peptidoglycan DD-metalloendopeptidase family protein [Deltaproteobacteria bacterium]|nr:peptidoglycan DD-metalloendopeptidase family protein [Deltaproteobacteria bacterium]